MAENKLKESGASVKSVLAELDDDQRKDSKALIELMERITGEPAKLWTGNIIGFGKYHYIYDSGREGDAGLTGFSPRKREFSIYLNGTYFEGMEAKREKLLAKLGKHRMGKACLYVKRLSDINLKVLEQLIVMGVDELKARYPA